MKISCPTCGTGGSITLFIADADARDAILAAGKLPSDCGTLVLKYIAMFAPVSRHLSMDRATRLISECCVMITDGVMFDRQRIEAPSHVWRQALVQMQDANIQRPLKNHHYLLRIVQGVLTKRADVQPQERATAQTGLPVRVRTQTGQTFPRRSMGTKPDALADLPQKDREFWLKKAKQTLLKEGFSQVFLAAPLIEQKAREMLMEACHD